MKGWAKAKQAARYAGVSERTLRGWLKQGLRSVALPTGTRLIRLNWVDDFLFQFEDGGGNQVDTLVNDVLKGL